MPSKPKILVISFSPIYRDARVLRELSAIAKHGDVTSIGYGRTPDFVDEHIEIPESAPSLPQTPMGVLKLAARRLDSSELAAPASQQALKLLGGREFDIIVANDARAIPLAFAVKGDAKVWADLHEWAPEERTHVLSWRLLVAPLMDHICKKYLPKCEATTTVGQQIADLYKDRYGVMPELVRNTAGYQELEPTPLPEGEQIRLVHSGAAVFGRDLETTITAVLEAGDRFTLDLYLVQANDGGAYLSKLKKLAEGSDRITFHAPVPSMDLPKTLNKYDVGVFWIPPFNTNARLTLPNKLFDYIQARIGIAVGPTIEMQNIVNEYNLGTVSRSFSKEDIIQDLRQMNRTDVEAWKKNTQTAAEELSFENESQTISNIIQRLSA